MFGSRSKKNKQNQKRRSLHIRTGDEVIVISGEDRSKTPRKVLSVLPKQGKVIVEGVNMMKDHQKNRPANTRTSGINQQGIIEKACPIDISNVALVDPKSKKSTRIRMKDQDGKKVRVAVKSGETV
ncbi:MAG: 50S ribosomal protein L24 [Armatimonadota bacterium]|nr:50S ribosomal protein L24 [Armatimonadota bacterium]